MKRTLFFFTAAIISLGTLQSQSLVDTLASNSAGSRRESLEKFKALSSEEALKIAQGIFGQDFKNPESPNFPLIRDSLLTALYKIDAPRLMKNLTAAGQDLWTWITPGDLMKITGPEALLPLDNLFLQAQIQPSSGQNSWPLILAAVWKTKASAPLLQELTFFKWPETMGPEDFRLAYEYFKAKGLPLDNLNLHIRARAGLMPPYTTPERTPSFDQLLMRALAIRLGIEKSREILSPPQLRRLSALPEVPVMIAAARVYGGFADANDKKTLEQVKNLSPALARRIILVCSWNQLTLPLPADQSADPKALTFNHGELGPVTVTLGPGCPPGTLQTEKASNLGREFQVIAYTPSFWLAKSWTSIDSKGPGILVPENPKALDLVVTSTGFPLKIGALFIGPKNQYRELALGTTDFTGIRSLHRLLPPDLAGYHLKTLKIFAPDREEDIPSEVTRWAIGIGQIKLTQRGAP